MVRFASARRGALALAAALAVLAFGYSPFFARADRGNTVTIDNFTFGPNDLAVAVGANVVWTNRDDIPHTVVSADAPAGLKSPPLDTDDHFEVRFDKAGIYKYFCSIHPKMTGTITVR